MYLSVCLKTQHNAMHNAVLSDEACPVVVTVIAKDEIVQKVIKSLSTEHPGQHIQFKRDSALDRILFKGPRMVIPKMLQKN